MPFQIAMQTNRPKFVAQKFVVCALYKFTALDHFASLRIPVQTKLQEYKIRGTILLAKEGINGAIAGTRPNIERFLSWLNQQPAMRELEVKHSVAEQLPFKRARVKLKKEIVTMGVADIDPRESVGAYVEPKDWNNMLDDADVLVVDTRNEYEIKVGRFVGRFAHATNPQTTNFREFPAFAAQHLNPAKHKKIAMYCTGGIRCEKSTAFLKQQGFDQVYHLKGGILKYLEQIPQSQSKWQGECFVFDDRVTVDHQLRKGSYDQCHACRLPITDQDKQSEKYQAGVSCPACFERSTKADKARYAEREKQVKLAQSRGQDHIGPEKFNFLF